MTARKLNILLLYDVPYAPSNHLSSEELMVGEEWRDERDVIRTLKRLGHKVTAFGIFDDIRPLVDKLAELKPDLVFNQCESFRADRAGEPNVPALLNLLGVPHTGAGAEALTLCKDKGLTKKILTFHSVKVPRFAVAKRQEANPKVLKRFVYPGVCKPLGLDSSEGIARDSLVTNEEDCLARLHYIHNRLHTDAIIEEYIEGRELYVGILGNERLTVLPPQELFFERLPSGAPRLLTYKAKWDTAYRRKYGIDSRAAAPLKQGVLGQLNSMCKTIYRLLKITGYARIDLRLRGDDELVCIEVNPNPSIKREDDFAWAARLAGISYDELINRLVHLALP